MSGLLRIRWPICSGLGGRIKSDWVAGLLRIEWPIWTGIRTRKEPVVNPNIDVNACVSRFLSVRERSNLHKRIEELKKLLTDNNLINHLTVENKRFLGIQEEA